MADANPIDGLGTPDGPPGTSPVLHPRFSDEIEQLLARARRLSPVKVAKTLRNPHPLVAATLRLPASKEDLRTQSRIAAYRQQPALHVVASEASKTRAFCIMDALIKRLEEVGGKVTIEPRPQQWERGNETVITLAGVQLRDFRLREKQKQVPISLDQQQPWGPKSTCASTGILKLEGIWFYSLEVLFCETARRRFEDALNDLIINLIQSAGTLQLRKQEEEADRQRQAEEERRRKEQEAEVERKRADLRYRQAAEQADVDELIRQANSWKTSQVVQEFLDAYCKALLERDGAIPTEGSIAERLKWAREQVARLNPLVKSPPSVLDEKI